MSLPIELDGREEAAGDYEQRGLSWVQAQRPQPRDIDGAYLCRREISEPANGLPALLQKNHRLDAKQL